MPWIPALFSIFAYIAFFPPHLRNSILYVYVELDRTSIPKLPRSLKRLEIVAKTHLYFRGMTCSAPSLFNVNGIVFPKALEHVNIDFLDGPSQPSTKLFKLLPKTLPSLSLRLNYVVPVRNSLLVALPRSLSRLSIVGSGGVATLEGLPPKLKYLHVDRLPR